LRNGRNAMGDKGWSSSVYRQRTRRSNGTPPKRFGITYPLFLWEQEKLPPLLRRIAATPTTLLLDRTGRIVEVQVGLLFGERLTAWERKIAALLQKRPDNARR
jgi:hypothetical protein